MAYGLCHGRPFHPDLRKNYMDYKRKMKNINLREISATALADRMEHELRDEDLLGKASGNRSAATLPQGSKKTLEKTSGAKAPTKATAVRATTSPKLAKAGEDKDDGPSTSKFAQLRQRLGMKPTYDKEKMGERNRAHEHKARRVPKIPPPGQPGAFDDPLRKGLSGAGCRWYLRYLEKGLIPEEARRKAEEHRAKEQAPAHNTGKRGGKMITPPQKTESKRRKIISSSQKDTHKAAERTASKSYADVTSAIRIAVLPKEYPEVNLTTSELTALEEAIISEVAKGWTHKLKFEGIHFRPGYILVDCKDAQTAEWMKTAIPGLSTWKGAPLAVCAGEEVPRAHNITFFLPRSAGQTTEHIMALIGAQNEGLQMSLWRILKIRDEGSGKLMKVGIDEQSFEAIRSSGNVISYRFGEIPVHGMSEKKKDLVDEDRKKEAIHPAVAVEQAPIDAIMEIEQKADGGERNDGQHLTVIDQPTEEEERMLLSGSSVGNSPPQ